MMDKKTDIWMPFFVGDYLADTARLTTEQHGAYLLLILDYWRNGSPPNNPDILRQITKLDKDAYSNAQAMLLSFFDIVDGKLIHSRIEKELVKAKLNQKKNHERAVAAAEKRWGNANSNATSNAQAMHNECPSPSPSETNNKRLTSSDDDNSVKIDYQGIVDLYNRILPELPAVRTITKKRRSAMKTCATTKPRYSGLDFWEAYFTEIRKSDFLMGRKTDYKADFDFMVTHSKFIKVIEGAYK